MSDHATPDISTFSQTVNLERIFAKKVNEHENGNKEICFKSKLGSKSISQNSNP